MHKLFILFVVLFFVGCSSPDIHVYDDKKIEFHG